MAMMLPVQHPAKRRTLAYTRVPRRTRSRVAPRRPARDTEGVLLHHPGPYELPSATLHTRGTLVGTFRRWLTAQWRWLRPRTIPVVVAFIGLCGVVAATNYLTNFTHADPPGNAHVEVQDWDHGHLVPVDRVTIRE